MNKNNSFKMIAIFFNLLYNTILIHKGLELKREVDCIKIVQKKAW